MVLDGINEPVAVGIVEGLLLNEGCRVATRAHENDTGFTVVVSLDVFLEKIEKLCTQPMTLILFSNQNTVDPPRVSSVQ